MPFVPVDAISNSNRSHLYQLMLFPTVIDAICNAYTVERVVVLVVVDWNAGGHGF